MSTRPTLWKYSTLALAGALAFSWGGALVPTADAAAPKRLSAALAALRASKRHLDDAKDPPATFHNQSVTAVTNAITAVEKEIKAMEDGRGKRDSDRDRDHEKGEKKSDKKASDKAKEADPKPSKKSAAHSSDSENE